MADLKGINPSICMHHIYCEDNTKPFKEMQRKLSPNMRGIEESSQVAGYGYHIPNF